MSGISHRIATLVAGSQGWSAKPPEARATVAAETARSTAAVADAWVEATVAIKQASSDAVRAEETATGPLTTLRLLLVTAGALAAAGRGRLPRLPVPLRISHGGQPGASKVEVETIPAMGPRGSLHDAAIFGGHRAIVRCANPGSIEAFEQSWKQEMQTRPRTGGVALVLGAGNVTGLGPADAISQIFEHGRAALLKLHPLHEPLLPVLEQALAPLIRERLLELIAGGVEVATEALETPGLTHVHLTGGEAAFESLVWGAGSRSGAPRLVQSITCELGNVSPWIILPGSYSKKELACQADAVAASMINNTSFNCIATKLVVTAQDWDQRDAFLELVKRRLATVPLRQAWFPRSRDTWQALTQVAPPADGTLPWTFRTGVDPDGEPQYVEREWFVPVVAEVPLKGDSIESFCTSVHRVLERLPGSLAASVTLPKTLSPRDAARAELLIEHLPFGVVAVNTWSALAYSLGNTPWGGFPGGTLAEPKSGIGHVHDPLMLPLVHNTILRAPLTPWPKPAWFPWHRRGLVLARGLVDVYRQIAHGRRGVWPLARMLPAVLSG